MSRTLSALALVASLNVLTDAHAKSPSENQCYELRIYTAADGKLDALHARFRDHTTKLFEKHGMTNVGYFTALDGSEPKLYYVLSFPDKDARKKAWAGFMTDPEWLAAWRASEKNGKLVNKVESKLLHRTDYSPILETPADKAPRVFELRTYTCTPGNLSRLNARFRDHTLKLFAKHGMTNLIYWELDAGQPAAADTLVYLLAHPSKEAHDANFDAFRKDPAWTMAKEASEKAAGGSLTAPDGVKSIILKPTDYSPLK